MISMKELVSSALQIRKLARERFRLFQPKNVRGTKIVQDIHRDYALVTWTR